MTRPARIPSDVNRPDRVVGPFTARQTAILAATGVILYLLWAVLRDVVPLPVLLIGALPVAALAFVIAVGQRDGLSLDRLLLAALRHRLTSRRPAARRRGSDVRPGWDEGVPGWINAHACDELAPARGRPVTAFPARTVTAADVGPPARRNGGIGVVDLGADGLVVIAAVSTVNFALRTPTEQDGLVAGFARYLHALGGPVQILIRALPLDLTGHLHHLHTQSHQLPHPALAAAADGHLQHLARLAHHLGEDELLTRQLLLILREPAPRTGGQRAAEHRLLRRLHDAATLLAPLEVTVTALDAARTTALLTSTCNPDHLDEEPRDRGEAPAGDVVVRSTRTTTEHSSRDRDRPDPDDMVDMVDMVDSDGIDDSDNVVVADADDDLATDEHVPDEAVTDEDDGWAGHWGWVGDGGSDPAVQVGEGWGPDPWTDQRRRPAGAGRWPR